MSMYRRATRRYALTAVAAIATIGLLAACSSAKGDPAASSSAGDSKSGVAYAKDQIAKYETTATPKIAGDPVQIGDKLKGKVVWDIVYLAIVPGFQASFKAIDAAAKKMGGSAQICDAGATPAGGNSCMEQAINAGAAAIFLDNVKVDDVSGPMQDAVKAKIPVVTLDQLPAKSFKADATELGYSPFPQTPMAKLVADYVIAQSEGKANVVMTEIADDPTAQKIIQTATAEYDKYCPGCKYSTVQTKATSTDQIPSVVSAGLLKNPNADWLVPEFDNFASLAQQGMEQSGKDSSSIHAVSAGGSLGAVQDVAAGGFLNAVVAENVNHAGWSAMNILVHMLAGKPLAYGDSALQYQVITKDAAAKLKLTAAAYASGEWFGSTSYQDDYLKHWGVTN